MAAMAVKEEVSQPQQQGEGVTSVASNTPSLTSHSVDSALVSGLKDSRERLGLLKLEQVFIDFCNDPELNSMDIGGPMNSVVRKHPQQQQQLQQPYTSEQLPLRPSTTFQRCLLHRLADRFGISRKGLADGYIRIQKTAQTHIPHMLLLNVKPLDLVQFSTEPNVNNNSSNNVVAARDVWNRSANGASTNGMCLSTDTSNTSHNIHKSTTSNTASTTPKPPKMKIMKRQQGNLAGGANSSKSKQGNDSNNKSRKSCTGQNEKEKQYAQARARIFQQSQEDAWKEGVIGDDTHTDSSTLIMINPQAQQVAVGGDVMAVPTIPTAAAATTVLPYHSLSAPSSLTVNASTQESVFVQLQHQQHQSSHQNIPNNINNNNTSKATYRNRLAEQADPDFRRRRMTNVPMYGYGGNNSGGPTLTAPVGAAGVVPMIPYPTNTAPSIHMNHFMQPITATFLAAKNSTMSSYGSLPPTQPPQLPHNHFYSGVSSYVPNPPPTATTSATAKASEVPEITHHSLHPTNKDNSSNSYFMTHPHQHHSSTNTHHQHLYDQQQLYRRWHSDSETLETTTRTPSVPSIHSSKDFPSLKR